MINVLEGEPVTDYADNLIVTGIYEEEIEQHKTYTILAKEVEHETYGIQYELLFIGEIVDVSGVAKQKLFLQTFLSDLQIEEMFKALENPLQTILSHDVCQRR